MTVTIPDVMRHVRNYFVYASMDERWQTLDGTLLPEGLLSPGDWIAITDGPLCGVHQLDEYGGIPGAGNVSWEGRICLLTPPAGFLRLCCEIAAWVKAHPDPSAATERFGEYSRTLAHTDWTQAFAPALARYTRMYPEVNL